MNIKYYFKNIKIISEEQEYIEKKIGSIKKLVDKIIKTEIEVGKDKRGMVRVEVMITVPGNKFRAEETRKSVEESVDIVTDELKTQIRRNKEKIWTKIIRRARSLKKRNSINDDARF